MNTTLNNKIYELVDYSDQEHYFTLGHWTTLQEVLDAIKGKEPEDINTPADIEDYFKLEVREHTLGWSGFGKLVYQREWTRIYNEEKDEYHWRETSKALPDFQ